MSLTFHFRKRRESKRKKPNSIEIHPKWFKRDAFPGHFWTSKFHRISFNFKCKTRLREELHSCLGKKTLSTACWISFRIFNGRHFGAKGSRKVCINLHVWVKLYWRFEPQNSSQNASVQCVCMAQKYRLLEAIKKKNVLPLFLQGLSGFCFDSFYFITYLCLNEEETYFIPTSKEICTSLYYLFVFVLIQSYTHWTLSLLFMNFFFVYSFWQCEVEENTDHNYSLSCPLHLVSLCCSVSDNCTVFLISKVGIWFSFCFFCFFWICSKTNSK